MYEIIINTNATNAISTTSAATTIITDAIPRTIADYISNIVMLQAAMPATMGSLNMNERSCISSVLMHTKSILIGMEEHRSPFLMSVYTKALRKDMNNPLLEIAGDKFMSILNEKEQAAMITLDGAFRAIDEYFRDYEE